MKAPTCLLCANDWMVFLLREAPRIAIMLTAHHELASSLHIDVAEVAIITDEVHIISWISLRALRFFGSSICKTRFMRPIRFPASFVVLSTKCVVEKSLFVWQNIGEVLG